MTEPTKPTEATAIPATAKALGITTDGQVAFQIDFADPNGDQKVIFTLDPEAVFPFAFDLRRNALEANPVAGEKWLDGVERMILAAAAPKGSA